MPAHEDPKREAFCQGVAKGLTKGKACMDAGFNVTTTASAAATATRLLKEDPVRARIAELSMESERKEEEEPDITEASVLSKLVEAFNMAKEENRPQAMVAAAMGMAKVKGLIIDKKEVGPPNAFAEMSDEELDEFIRTEAAEVLPQIQQRKQPASRTRH